MIDPDLLLQTIDGVEHGVYLCNPDGALVYVNPGFAQLCGYSRKELIGSPISIIRSGVMDDEYYAELWRTLLAGERWQEEITNRKKDGTLYLAFQIITPILGADDETIAFFGIQREISDCADAETLMRENPLEIETIFSNAQDALFLIDVDGDRFTFRKASRSHQRLTGMPNADVIGRSPGDVYGSDGGNQRETHYRRCVTSEHPVTFEEILRTNENERILETKISPIRRSGRVVQLIGSSREITQRKCFERELQYLSETDMLTNIPNRRKISEELNRELSRSHRHGRPLSILLVDVDHFKRVNDELGHEMGDTVLRGIASTLEASLRPSDRVGRWGGEEFVVLMPETDREGARVAAERIRSAVEDSRILEKYPMTVSIGIATSRGRAPAERDDGLADSPESLLRIADEALYRAKAAGRNRVSG